MAGSVDTGTHPAGYYPAGFGDYNNDGTDDILWYNPTTRDVDLWKISNGQWAGSVNIGTYSAGYEPTLSGDFNGDGTDEILWGNASTRDAEIWKISNGERAGSADVASIRPVTSRVGWRLSTETVLTVSWHDPTTNAIDIWKISMRNAGGVDVGAYPPGGTARGGVFSTWTARATFVVQPEKENIDIWLSRTGSGRRASTLVRTREA